MSRIDLSKTVTNGTLDVPFGLNTRHIVYKLLSGISVGTVKLTNDIKTSQFNQRRSKKKRKKKTFTYSGDNP